MSSSSNNSNSASNANGNVATNPSIPAVAGSNHQFYRLKVEDALSYLDQVKYQFERQPEVYNNFLDIMKEFKSQTIDTPGVITRVSTLFHGHTDLIEGFNTFLPPGYKIEVQANDSVHYTAPNSTLSTLVQPIVKPAMSKNNEHTTLKAEAFSGNGTPSAAGSSFKATASIPLAVKVLSTNTNGNQPTTNNPCLKQVASPSSPSTSSTSSQQTISNTQITNSNSNSSGHVNQAQSQVEFGHAINYVNKIKSRFHNQPDIYKSFLEILHTYQKQQKNLKDVRSFCSRDFYS